MYIHHITLSTGHTRRSPRAEVSDDTIQALQPWLKAALAYQDDFPLPGPLGARDGFVAHAHIKDGALICGVGHRATGPLATFGVAARSRQAGELWAWLCAQYGAQGDLKAPGAPWCAVALHEGYLRQAGASAWLGDFERCVAWAWIESEP